MKVAVSGASGFIGSEVCRLLTARSHQLVALGSMRAGTDEADLAYSLERQLAGVDAVIHLAASAHVMDGKRRNSLAEFRHANVDLTKAIARAAVDRRVRRFIFVSSIGVLGSHSGSAHFCEATPTAPTEPYAISKLEAEAAVISLCSSGNVAFTIVRPPLVYGPRVRGNFLRLLHAIHAGWPLPLAAIDARRSFIGVTNLASLLLHCANSEAAANQVFVASDGEDISLSELLPRLGRLMDRPLRLFAFPRVLLRAAAAALGHGAEAEKLLASLRVDSTKCRTVLGWSPTKDLNTGLEEMARWYVDEASRHAD
jgi:nucleoside-diphosphate-sugar epimerase